MTIAVVVFGLFMASLVGWLVKQSVGSQPWVASGPSGEALTRDDHVRQSLRLSLVVLIAVIASLFGLFLSAYLMRMQYADWRPLPEPGLLWGTTAILVLCSVALQGAYFAARRGSAVLLKVALVAGGALSLLFIIGQYTVWQQLNAQGFYLGPNPASAFFFLLTALHALHILGGLVAWGRTTLRAFSGARPAELRLGTELCAVYWHFLLAVWVVLFALLSST